MALTNKLYCYKTKAAFDTDLAASQIPETGIAFIKDIQQIWTHGTYFGVGEKYSVTSTTAAGLCPQLSGSASQYLSGTGVWTNIPTALKTPNALTISLNGTSQGAFDGSAAKSINITAASVGAAATSHTHTAAQVSGLATVATSGSYNDLSNKPTIPTLSGEYGPETGKYVSGVTVSGHAVTVHKDSLPTSLPANGGTADKLAVADTRAAEITPLYLSKTFAPWFSNVGTPNSAWWSGIHINGWEGTGYAAWELAGRSDSVSSDDLYFRSGVNTTWKAWRKLAFADEIPAIPSLTGGSAASANQYVSGVTVSGHAVTVTKGTLPTTLPCPGTLTFTGGASGSYNGSGNVSISIPVNTDTHWTTGISAGASGTASNSSTGNPYLKVSDNGTYRAQVRLVGSGATSVSSDASGNITISSSDTNTNTTYSFSAGTNCFYVTPSGGTQQTVSVTPSIANNITGSGTSGYIAKFNGGNTITNGPAFGSSTSSFLRNDGAWATPPNATYAAGTGLSLSGTTFSVITPVTKANVMSAINETGEITFTQHVTCSAGVANTSDIRYKANRESVSGVLGKLEDIDVFTYNWENPNKTLEPTKIGISAQQMEEKFGAALVNEEEIQERETKVVDIPGQIAVLFAGMKELIAENKKLKEEIEKLKQNR